MNKTAASISARLSLRPPQEESLEILSKIVDLISLGKDVDVAAALASIKSEYSTFVDFERDFPSFCFSLATGVGKTRLMGAFITYLYLSGQSRHFFLLAPNLTIYDKLIADFTPSSPKYVFKGIGEFATRPPVIVTGDNFQKGEGVRFDYAKGGAPRAVPRAYETERVVIQKTLFEPEDAVIINIFNVSKIDSESRKGKSPRIKRLQEYIGESYFDYLSSLPDLVLLMDEAHRYRAIAGAKAINELKPILGLELTATPKTIGQNSKAFSNVIYNYPLGAAMQDGFVKEPAVATRKDFKPEDYSREALELIKLEDGVHHHEHVKVELQTYSNQTGKPLVKPFMLVVAQDTTHASQLRTVLESKTFFDGRYKDHVIEVHSNLTGQESDEATQRLLSVEHDNLTEIVIHVNKLKEGWDVTNLYTIVPLRASASEILTEQTIGRGLRLPYGKRTGVESIDRLTIVAHDKFQDIIDSANDPNSIIKKTVIIGDGGDISTEKSKALVVPSLLESMFSTGLDSMFSAGNLREESGPKSSSASTYSFDTAEKRNVANVVLEVVKQYERLESSQRLQEPGIQREIEVKVRALLSPTQLTIPGVETGPDVAAIVNVVTQSVAELTIDVPRISVIATSEVTFGFKDFDLQNLASVRYPPVSQDILIQELRTNQRAFLVSANSYVKEERLEDYVIRGLIDRDEVDYDRHSDLLYKLSGQLVAHLRSYLSNDDQVENVLLFKNAELANFVFSQMLEHSWETPTDYTVRVNKGFTVLRPNSYNVYSNEQARQFRAPLSDRSGIKRMLFTGFKKCCYPIQKFDSDSERRFAVILEDDESVMRWMKPAIGHFQIEWKNGFPYQPDFVVETVSEKFICEPKATTEVDSVDVLLKADAARRWCNHANEHAKVHGGKSWSYLLIPHTEIQSNRTLEGLKASFSVA